MKTYTFNTYKVKQPIGEFYISKINARDLYQMAKADIIRINSLKDNLYDGIQRKINPEKVKGIVDYLTSIDATFPNSIILNVDKKYVKYANDGKLEVFCDSNTFSIIDGQHRLEGFKHTDINFELVVSIFIGLSEFDQSRIFTTINSEQTKVNPSIQVYHESNEEYYTPRKVASKITIMFNTSLESPWYNRIKLIGIKDQYSEEGILSSYAFRFPILSLIYDDDDHNKIRNLLIKSSNNQNIEHTLQSVNYNKAFWSLYLKKNESAIYKILFNYFTAISSILKKEWGNKSSILTKTTGYNAMMQLFDDIFELGKKDNSFTIEYIKNKLSRLEELSGKLNTEYYGASGLSASKDLYIDMKKTLRLGNL